MGKPGRVGWHELLADDWEKALAFYGELFDWRKANADAGPMGTYQLFSIGGQTIGGMFTKPPIVPVPFWLYYFNVPDIDAAAEHVKAGGGQIIEGPAAVPGSWILRCTDPQGAMFALMGSGPTRRSAISSAPRRAILPTRATGAGPGEDFQPGAAASAPRPSANKPTGPSTWNSRPVIFANRSILMLPIAQPPSPMSIAIR